MKLRGVKNTFSSNEVYNIADMALNFAIVGDSATSLDCVIENNSFHDVILTGTIISTIWATTTHPIPTSQAAPFTWTTA